MNIFRILGDVSHLFAIALLLVKVHSHRSIRGLSFTTQVLYLVVYCARYSDLSMWYWTSTYTTIGKIVWLATSSYVVVVMSTKFRMTREVGVETVKVEHLAGPCLAVALCFNYALQPLELLWTFSIYLEAVAVVPQLFLTYNSKRRAVMAVDPARDVGGRPHDDECHVLLYLALMAAYRALYVANWARRYHTEVFECPVSVYGGIVQTAIYVAFFVLYHLK
ncbi:hypothetical protein JCM3766R1_002018 [Sporobolomyces carnicolor]